jgi:hypothetical protein
VSGCVAEAWWVRGKTPLLGRQSLGLMSCEVWLLSLVMCSAPWVFAEMSERIPASHREQEVPGTLVVVQGAATPDAMPLVNKIWDDKPDLDSHDGLLWQLAHGQKFIGKQSDHFDDEPIDDSPVFDEEPIFDEGPIFDEEPLIRVLSSNNFNNEMLGFESSDEDFSEESKPVGPLHDATRKGEMDTCRHLVENLGFDVVSVTTDGSGLSPLACAVSWNSS